MFIFCLFLFLSSSLFYLFKFMLGCDNEIKKHERIITNTLHSFIYLSHRVTNWILQKLSTVGVVCSFICLQWYIPGKSKIRNMVTVTDFLLAHALLYSSAVLLPSAAFVRSPCCDLSKPPRGGPPLPLPRMNGKPPRPRPLGLPRVIIDIKACIIGLYYLGPLPIPTIFFLFGCIVICRPLNSVPSNRSAFCAVSALSNST